MAPALQADSLLLSHWRSPEQVYSKHQNTFEEECGIDNRRVEQIENGNLVLGFQKETNVDIIILFYSLPSRSIIVKFLFM